LVIVAVLHMDCANNFRN